MHSQPDPAKKYLFVDQDRMKIYSFGFFSTVILFTGNIYFIMAVPGAWPYAIFVFLTLFYLSLSYFVGFFGKSFNLKKHNEIISNHWFHDYSQLLKSKTVDIYLPICGEEIDIIKNTWKFVGRLAGNHPKAKVYVLDDKPTPVAKLIAEAHGFNYITRETNELKKAGNLRNAFKQTDGEYILILDADFCPSEDFLNETLPYMLNDQQIAIVQTPQYFSWNKNQNWIANGAGIIQELFYRLIQVNRDTFNGAVCVGTNALYRRSALAPFGGTAPMPYSEDVHTGFQIISNGGKIKYIPIILAEGICPDTVKQFFTQQYRWALGSISLFFSNKFWTARITTMQRLCYLTGMFYYITTGLGVVFVAIPSIIMLLVYPDKIYWFNLLFSVPSFLFTTVFMKYWQKSPMTVEALRCRQIAYFAHLYALRDFIFGSLEEWKPTGAKTNSARYEAFKRFYRVWQLSLALGITFLVCALIYYDFDPKNFILLMAFTAFNTWVALPPIKDF